MTLLLWFCGLAMTALLLTAWREGRDGSPDRWWSYPAVQPIASATAVDEGALMRANGRAALQTGAAILAVALALDVSSAPLAWFSPPEPEAASSAAASGLFDYTDAPPLSFSAYASTSWPNSGSDGWFV